ncbi:MAG: LysM peptidoglycan-binding domain-containing protein [Planctomycetaceae bacterium]
MKTETKFGLLTILILLGVFGYVVYEKWEERKAIIAAGGDPDQILDENGEVTDPNDPFKGGDGTELVNVSNETENTADLSNSFSSDFNLNEPPPDSFTSNEASFEPAAQSNLAENSNANEFASSEPDFGSDLNGGGFDQSNPFPEETAPQNLAQNDAFTEEPEFGSDLGGEPAPQAGTGSNFEAFNEPAETDAFENAPLAQQDPPTEELADSPFEAELPENTQAANSAPQDLNAFDDLPAEFSQGPVENNNSGPAEDAFAGNEEPETFQEEPAFNLNENELFEETSSPSELVQKQAEQAPLEDSMFADQNELEEPILDNEVFDSEPSQSSPQEAFSFDEPGELDIATTNDSAPFDGVGESPFAEKSPSKPTRPDPFAQANKGEYVVQQGDNLWKISQKLYGSGSYVNALAQYNRQNLPDASRLKPGMILKTPDVSLLSQGQKTATTNISLANAKTNPNDPFAQKSGFFTNEETGEPFYKVQPNDTLTEIAYRHLGRASRWIQIVALNQEEIKDPKSLKPGTILRLPSDARTVVLASDSFESDRN